MGRKKKETFGKLERKFKIAGTLFDRRVKITPDEKMIIRQLRCDGKSYYSLAKEYGVHHKTIMRICDPSLITPPKNQNREKARENLRNSREYKKKLLYFGKVNLENVIEKGTDKEFKTKFKF